MSHHEVSFLHLALIPASTLIIKSLSQFGGFRKSPGQILVAILLVALALYLALENPVLWAGSEIFGLA